MQETAFINVKIKDTKSKYILSDKQMQKELPQKHVLCFCNVRAISTLYHYVLYPLVRNSGAITVSACTAIWSYSIVTRNIIKIKFTASIDSR